MQQSQMSLQDPQNNFDPPSSHDDFLDQMLSGLQTAASWPDISAGNNGSAAPPWDVDHFDDQSSFLASKLRQNQINVGAGGTGTPSPAVKSLMLQQQLLLSRGLAAAGHSGMYQNDIVDPSSLQSPINENSIQNIFNGFRGSLETNQFHNSPGNNFGSQGTAAAVMNQGHTTTSATAGGGGAPSQPRQRVRARRGQATDPHSIAERLRRERIAERMKGLQELVPNANKTDKASMLDEIIDYVKFLQLQVKVLSMSRLGGAPPLGADISSEGGGDCGQGSVRGGGRSSTVTASSSNNGTDTNTVTENQVVKLMEEDMGSAMQYLQGKGLCLMPISLATAISSATSRSNHLFPAAPSSPNLSVLSVQSSANGLPPEPLSVKDSACVSKP